MIIIIIIIIIICLYDSKSIFEITIIPARVLSFIAASLFLQKPATIDSTLFSSNVVSQIYRESIFILQHLLNPYQLTYPHISPHTKAYKKAHERKFPPFIPHMELKLQGWYTYIYLVYYNLIAFNILYTCSRMMPQIKRRN